MAPSSMRSGASGSELLAARDARQALLDRHLAAPGRTVVALSLAIPGEEKVPAGAAALFDWACAEALAALPGARPLGRTDDALGPFALLAVPAGSATPDEVKRRCVALETARPAARLLDLDVHVPGGGALDRAALALPARACLCCDAPARECIRAGRHGFAALVSRARELLAHG